jgi:hypothetical protein
MTIQYIKSSIGPDRTRANEPSGMTTVGLDHEIHIALNLGCPLCQTLRPLLDWNPPIRLFGCAGVCQWCSAPLDLIDTFVASPDVEIWILERKVSYITSAIRELCGPNAL